MGQTKTQKKYQTSTAEFEAYIRYIKDGLIKLREYIIAKEKPNE